MLLKEEYQIILAVKYMKAEKVSDEWPCIVLVV